MLGGRIIEQPWTVVATDVMEFPRSKSGMSYLVVFQDLFTKWIEVMPLRQATGSKIKDAFDDLIMTRWGVPRVLLSDNGTEYVNKILKSFSDSYGIFHTTTPPYTPRCNPVERVNRSLKTMIIAFLGNDHREWDVHVKEFRFAYNTSVHSSTKFSPAFLNFARDPLVKNSKKLALEKDLEIETTSAEEWAQRLFRIRAIQEWIANNMEDAHDRQSKYYNKKHRFVVYSVGDIVWIRNRVLSSAINKVSGKLVPRFKGPFEITKVLSPLVYQARDKDGKIINKVSISDVKPYRGRLNVF